MYFPILCSSPSVCYKQTVKSKAASTCSHQTHHRRGRVRGACQPRVPASGGDNTPVREVILSGLSVGIAVGSAGRSRDISEAHQPISICSCSKPSQAHPRRVQVLPPAAPLALLPSLSPTEVVPQATRNGMCCCQHHSQILDVKNLQN